MKKTIQLKKSQQVETLTAAQNSIFKRIAKEFESPLYVYFESDLIKNAQTFFNIPSPFGLVVRYAVKANPNGAILNLYNKQGLHFDASTFNECIRIVSNGIPGNKIRLTSQEVQTSDNLQFIAKKGILYTACSLLQLETWGRKIPNSEVGVRFNIGIGSGHSPQTTTGGENFSFGIFDQKEKIKSLLKKYNLIVKTVHLHIGSGSDPIKQKSAIQKGLKMVEEYKDVTTLNMGGGFKVAGMSYEHGTDVSEMGREMSQAIRKFYTKTGRKIILELEPGTALVAKTGYILTEIIDIVSTGEQGFEFLKTNGGMNMNARIGFYGSQHPLIIVPKNKSKRAIKEYVVVGVCCESGDILTVVPGKPDLIDTRSMLEAEVGDLLVVGRAGAYCSSMAPGNYNSQQIHPEVLVRTNGKIAIIRQRQPLEDLWKYEKNI